MKLNRRTQRDVGSAPIDFIEFYRVDIARSCCGAPQSQLRRPFAARTVDGTRRSTVGTLNMGIRAGTGEALA